MFDPAAFRIHPLDVLGHESVLMLIFVAAMVLVLAALSALDRSGRSRRR